MEELQIRKTGIEEAANRLINKDKQGNIIGIIVV